MSRTHVHCTRYPEEMWEAIEEYAAKRQTTPSYLIRATMDQLLREDQDDLWQ